jgi:hypothetical protein
MYNIKFVEPLFGLRPLLPFWCREWKQLVHDMLLETTRFTRSGWGFGPFGDHGAEASAHAPMHGKSSETTVQRQNL